MEDFFRSSVSVVCALFAAVPITLGVVIVCVTMTATFVDFFGLNSNGSCLGMKVLNGSLIFSFLSYFFVFAYLVRFF